MHFYIYLSYNPIIVANGDMTVEEDAKLRGQGLQFIIYLAEALNL